MFKLFSALLDAIRFARSYQRTARIADDGASVPAHDVAATLQDAWAAVEGEGRLAATRERQLEEQALKAGSPSVHIALRAAAGETDFPA